MRRRTVGAFIALALLAGGTAQAVPPATGSPILGADTVVYSDRSASMTVQVPQAFQLNPWLFDVPAGLFSATREGSGFALVGLTGSDYPPTLVGVAAPEANRSRMMLFPFGDDGAGGDAFNTTRFPAGRYRLTIFTSGPTRISFHLSLPPRSPAVLRPRSAEQVPVQRLIGATPSSTGSVLGAQAPPLSSGTWAVVQTMTGRLDPSASGYESDWCVYSGGPPPLGYQPRCLGGSGLGTAQLGPLVNYDYCGFSAFLGIPPTQPLAVSRSLQGTGLVYDETAMFIWLRLPPIRSHYQAHGSTTARAVVRISNGVKISAK